LRLVQTQGDGDGNPHPPHSATSLGFGR
jgi:hypothetical protein